MCFTYPPKLAMVSAGCARAWLCTINTIKLIIDSSNLFESMTSLGIKFKNGSINVTIQPEISAS